MYFQDDAKPGLLGKDMTAKEKYAGMETLLTFLSIVRDRFGSDFFFTLVGISVLTNLYMSLAKTSKHPLQNV